MKVVVQCKLHKKIVGPSVIRDMYGAMIHSKADSAIVVSLTGFSVGAMEFAKGKPIELVDLEKLIRMSPKFKALYEVGKLS